MFPPLPNPSNPYVGAAADAGNAALGMARQKKKKKTGAPATDPGQTPASGGLPGGPFAPPQSAAAPAQGPMGGYLGMIGAPAAAPAGGLMGMLNSYINGGGTS